MSDRPKLKRSAVKVPPRSTKAVEAWFYENGRSIDVYVRADDRTHACRIPRSLLADWIKRTEPSSERGGK